MLNYNISKHIITFLTLRYDIKDERYVIKI